MKKIIVLVSLFISSFLWTACEECNCGENGGFTNLVLKDVTVVPVSYGQHYGDSSQLIDLRSNFYLDVTFAGEADYSALFDESCRLSGFGFTVANACDCYYPLKPKNELTGIAIWAHNPDTDALENVTSQFDLWSSPYSFDHNDQVSSNWSDYTVFKFGLLPNSSIPAKTYFKIIATLQDGTTLERKSRDVILE